MSTYDFLLLKNMQFFGMPLDLAPVKSKTKEFTLANLNHLAFLFIYNPFQLSCQVTNDALKYPISRPLRLYPNDLAQSP